MNRLIRNLCGLLLVAVLASCEKSVEYANLIPKDAGLVLTAVPMDLFSQANERDELKQWLTAESNELVKSLLKDPEVLGVDYRSPAFVFASLNRDEPTLLMKLNDRKALKKWLDTMAEKGLCKKIQQHNDFSWVLLPDQGYCVFTDQAVMWVYAPMAQVETLLVRWAELLKQKQEDSFLSTTQYASLKAMKEGIAFYFSFSFLPSDYSTLLSLPQEVSAEDLSVLGTLHRDQEKVSCVFRYYSENADLQHLIDEKEKLNVPLEMRYLNSVSRDAFLTLMGQLTKEMYANMLQTPGVEEAFSGFTDLAGIDMLRFLGALDGEFVTSIELGKSLDEFPKVIAYAQVDGAEMSDLLRESMNEGSGFPLPLKQLGPDNYSIQMGFESGFLLGIKDKKEFYLTSKNIVPFQSATDPLDKNTCAGMKGTSFSYLFCNLESRAVRELIGSLGGGFSFLNQILAIEMALRAESTVELNVYLRTR